MNKHIVHSSRFILWIALGIVFAYGMVPTSVYAASYVTSSHVSKNWAGYVAKEGKYTSIQSSWIVPLVSPDKSEDLAADAAWIGIGGVKAKDLIQAGTQAIVTNGKVEYNAWYETLPDFEQHLPIAIHAGDSVVVSLAEISPDTWHLIFLNATTGITFEKDIVYHSSHTSAEWIEEMPVRSTNGKSAYIPLDAFKSVHFKNSFAGSNDHIKTISALHASPITMIEKRVLLAIPSVLGKGGADFTVSKLTKKIHSDKSSGQIVF